MPGGKQHLLPQSPRFIVQPLSWEVKSSGWTLTGAAVYPLLWVQWVMPRGLMGWPRDSIRKLRRTSPYIPQLQDVGDIPRGEDPSDVVEVPHIEAPVGAAREGHGGQELVAISKAVAAGAGDASPAPVAHDAPDDRWLLRHKLVLPVPFVQDAWDKDKRAESTMEPEMALFCGQPQSPLDFCKEHKPSAYHFQTQPPGLWQPHHETQNVPNRPIFPE